jgi:NAD(P)-dependent dehydrogenase (short-subunit alcohol dehydrogenase family)
VKEFRDRVAVVTGAASGIGRGLAERFAAEGMKVVLADIEAPALAAAAQELADKGAAVFPYQADVSQAESVEALAGRVYEEFGEVHLLCNNAGVGGGGGLVWECTLEDWRWVMGVNLWGVIYGVKYFVPRMVAQGTEGHVVNTASMAGLTSGPGLGIYGVTKHGVVSLSETMFHELRLTGSQIGVSVLCPGFVRTNIMDSQRNRPAELQNPPGRERVFPGGEQIAEIMRQRLEQGMPPAEVAQKVFEAVRDRKFYILPHPQLKRLAETRMADILEERDPTLTPMV